MKSPVQQQILLGGVGGQGVLFVTSLLAEAAIRKNLSVLTSETHGMSQRGGTVVSHLKVGDFSSPMIRPRRADVLLALKQESIAHQESFLRPGGWIVVNGSKPIRTVRRKPVLVIDAERLAGKIGNPKSVNLVLLGYALGPGSRSPTGKERLFCSLEDIQSVLKERLAGKDQMLEACFQALEAGHSGA